MKADILEMNSLLHSGSRQQIEDYLMVHSPETRDEAALYEKLRNRELKLRDNESSNGSGDDNILSMPIEKLDWTVRVLKVFKSYNINRVQDLVSLSRDKIEELRKMRHMFHYIEELMAENDLHFETQYDSVKE